MLGTGYSHILEVSPHILLICSMGKITMEKCGEQNRNQMSKCNITNNITNSQHVSLANKTKC